LFVCLDLRSPFAPSSMFLVCLPFCLVNFANFANFIKFFYPFQLIFRGQVRQPNTTVGISTLLVTTEICMQHETLHPPFANPGKKTPDDMLNYHKLFLFISDIFNLIGNYKTQNTAQ
jgi:hypothetical protein